ncbi:SDR family oxidoreductase [Ramlibacter sp. Leaf400]|uniref:SDR family oxidoreductase n=1 Tax=Ramlibacter sp. Leaf400 TaxID=1736365 RepID=UPI0006FD41E0|nr:SDR family oxidoreductase [Ramlibacter sp. Leaf400]KQT13521.1 NmrA family transcriptional regulator [Ramlibacter sp. Leaf400]
MKVAVIGGSGLIGSRLVDNLRGERHEVVSASPRTGVNTVTGEGLAEALAGAQVVVDVSNSPSFEDAAVLDFFRTSTRNLVDAARRAQVGHLVILSVVGTDRLPTSGYFRAKLAQEELIGKSGLPFTIVRATQFYEFVQGIADGSTTGDTVRVPSALFQPMAARDVSQLLAAIAVRPPAQGIVEIAGPVAAPMAQVVSRLLHSKGDRRSVVAAPDATYFGSPITDQSLVPTSAAALKGGIGFEEWLETSHAGEPAKA